MLLDLIRSDNFKQDLAVLLLSVPVLLLSLILHEVAHGYVAYRCGDKTAKNLGRLSLNPAKHLDPLGTLSLFLIGFGWANPVPIIMRNFRKPRRDLMLVAAAGPLTNLLIAFVCTPIFILVMKMGNIDYISGMIYYREADIYLLFAMMLNIAVIINIGLALFNLLPIPPLDGSRLATSLLPRRLAVRYVQLERYSRQLLIGIIVVSNIANINIFYPLTWLAEQIMSLLTSIFSFIW